MIQNFIQQHIEKQLRTRVIDTVVTRFPPEPNGHLHIGHAKSIWLNFYLAQLFGGRCHLRLDDTNPSTENAHFIDQIQQDIQWLGFQWDDLCFSSNYFETFFQMANYLIEQGDAYVDSQSHAVIRQQRGTLLTPGSVSPFRQRCVDENRTLFHEMRAGTHPVGAHVLRLKIDMESANLNLRDPVIYRISYQPHHRTGTTWCLYPTYDFAHSISDALEGITHSLCTLEFEDHRPLYNWILQRLAGGGFWAKDQILPQQIEFARLQMEGMITSKRQIAALIQQGNLAGWDDPRLATLSGLRRRGYTPAAILDFCTKIGVSKANSQVSMMFLQACLRDVLNRDALRYIGVVRPLRLVIDNLAEDHAEMLSVPNHPKQAEAGRRMVRWERQLWIDRDDFMAVPSKGFFRLSCGARVRLRYAYVVECSHVEKNPQTGAIEAVHCHYFPDSKSGTEGANNYKVKGNIHWLGVSEAIPAQFRLFETEVKATEDTTAEAPIEVEQMVCSEGVVEPAVSQCLLGDVFQLERTGYFSIDSANSSQLVLNRTISLKDGWKKTKDKAGL